jgi:phosphoribosylglycinamide formyltransferase-1
MNRLLKIGVLVSGSGTNLQSIIDACAANLIPGQVVCVVSNKADAFGLELSLIHISEPTRPY